ncbi:AAA family ATPase [Porcipelethomonas sp.]|uniref:AAA family ATPase n=1 Tax=Porcipelethomonas sp. TaxID=2981675 RepID=UPI003EF64363
MYSNSNLSAAVNKISEILSEVNKAVIGKEDITARVLMTIIAGGHILIEDMPGVGKTTMALAFSKVFSLEYKRMQFTPDVLPTDILGFSVYNQNSGTFEYKPGAAVCSLFLADEINRTSSKTQSALLEVMEEKRISIDGKSYELPKPYIVIATQNPIGSVGTQMLPESQLDRFTIRLSMGYPDPKNEIEILKNKSSDGLTKIRQVSNANDIILLQKIAENIHADDAIYSYIVHLADATRKHPMIKLGLSPRGTLSLCAMAKACAVMSGRGYVIPDDVACVFRNVAEHRIILNHKARLSNLSAGNVLTEILKSVPVPKISV